MPDRRKYRNAPPLPVDEPPQRPEDREREIAAAEIKRIKAGNRRLREDVAFLKAATTYFARELDPRLPW